MFNYVLTREAVADLTSIWNYTYDVWSESQADKYYLLLIDGIGQAARKPEKCRNYDMITAGLKGIRIAKHIIFYLSTEAGIKIVRILHEQMDLKQHMSEE